MIICRKTSIWIGSCFLLTLSVVTSSVSGNIITSDSNWGPDVQHGKNIVNPPVGHLAFTTAAYKTETELRVLTPHVVDRQHPWPNPAPQWQHHHAIEPAQFNFSQRYWVTGGDIGSEPALLPGFPSGSVFGDPYTQSYEMTFFKEGNAEFVLDEGHPWTGKVDIIEEGAVNSFGFSISVLGTGIGFSLGWDTEDHPFTMNFSGDIDEPGFTFSFLEGFSMTNGSLLQVSGWTKNEDVDKFGRIGNLGRATVVEDITVLGGPEIVGWLKAPVYDVLHGIPEPATVFLLGLGSLALLRGRRRWRETRQE